MLNGTSSPTSIQLRSRCGEDRDRALVRRAQTEGTPSARHEAVAGLLPLARSLARRYARGADSVDDLEQVACVGLIKAIDGFDLSRETAFGAYAVPKIVGELRRHFRDRGWAVRVPRDLQELSLRMLGTQDEMTAQLGRAPTPAELAGRLGVSVERVLEARELGTAMSPISLDRPATADAESEGDALVDLLGADEAGYGRTEVGLTADSLLDGLDERRRRIVDLRFREELTQTEIGARLGISQIHVSRLLSRALADLAAMADEGAYRSS